MMAGDEYLKHTVVANITPGAFPVKLGATCGYRLGGWAGGLLGAYGVMLPGMALVVGIMAAFSLLGEQMVEYISCASVGITAFILFVLLSYIRRIIRGGHLKANMLLCFLALFLTGGQEAHTVLEQLTGMPFRYPPLFDISTIDLMLLAFFMILLVTLTKYKAVLLAGGILCGGYAFLVGKHSRAVGWDAFGKWILLSMAALLLALLVSGIKCAAPGYRLHVSGATCRVIAFFLAVPLIMTIVVICLTQRPDILDFEARVFISTLTSFGGGDAYISVADGIFVQGGYISPELFYTQLLPVANSLPGPILIKIVGGVGYIFGSADSSVLSGVLVAMSSAALATGICGALAILVMDIYESIKESTFIAALQQYILPVICGMLLSTSCALLSESVKVMTARGLTGNVSLSIMIISVCLLFVIRKKRHINDLILLISFAVLSTVGLLLI